MKDTAKEEKWGFKLAETLAINRSTGPDGKTIHCIYFSFCFFTKLLNHFHVVLVTFLFIFFLEHNYLLSNNLLTDHYYITLYISGISVFSSCSFFLTDGVADVNAPSLGEIQSIVESGGGTWIHGTEAFIEFCRIRHTNPPPSSSSSSSTTKSTKKRDIKSSESSELDENKNIVILSSEAAYASLGVHVRTAITSALQSDWVMGDGVYSLEVLFLAVLKQQLDFQSNNNLSQSSQSINSQASDSHIVEKKKVAVKKKKAK